MAEREPSYKSHVIYSGHTRPNVLIDGSIWPGGTREYVTELTPGPRVFAVDSLVPGFTSPYMDRYFPFLPTELFNKIASAWVLCADVPNIYQAQSVDAEHPWRAVFDELMRVDKRFDPPANIESNSYGDQLLLGAYALDSVEAAGVVHVAHTFFDGVRQTEKNLSIVQGPVEYNPARRWALQTIGAIVAGAGVAWTRAGILELMTNPQSPLSDKPYASDVAHAMLPMSGSNSYLDTRNAKIGFAMLDYMRLNVADGGVAAIVLGFKHKDAVYPAKKSGESPHHFQDRLLDPLHRLFVSVAEGLASQGVAKDERARALKTLFASYDVHELTNGLDGYVDQKITVENREIPEIADCIDWVVAQT